MRILGAYSTCFWFWYYELRAKENEGEKPQMLTVKRCLTTQGSEVLCNDPFDRLCLNWLTWKFAKWQQNVEHNGSISSRKVALIVEDTSLGNLGCSLILSRAVEPLSLSHTSTTSRETHPPTGSYSIWGIHTRHLTRCLQFAQTLGTFRKFPSTRQDRSPRALD